MPSFEDRQGARNALAFPDRWTEESGAHPIAANLAGGALADPPQRFHDTPLLPASPRVMGALRATLTIMSGMEAGRVIPLAGDATVIGRETGIGLSIEDPGLSRRHARVGRSADGNFYIEDLGSRNGTLVRGRRVAVAPLESGDYVQLGGSLLVRFALIDATDEEMRRRLYESSIHDPLTRVYNRRYFFRRLEAEMSSARRTGEPLALLMLDIDEFKRFNDTYGHLPGDRALCFIAAHVARSLRAGNVLARYGGEEFVVLSPGATHADATQLAERIRRGIEGLHFSVGGNSVSLTLSIGVASLGELAIEEPGAALVGLADERLYAAKRAGRNVVQGGTWHDAPGANR